MSTQGHGVDITLIAAADLTGKQFYAVKIDSNGKAALCGAGERASGVLQNNPNAGEAGTVRISGITKMKAGGSITAGALVAADANAKAKAAVLARTDTSDGGGAVDPLIGSNVIGIATTGAADGDLLSVLLQIGGAAPTTAA